MEDDRKSKRKSIPKFSATLLLLWILGLIFGISNTHYLVVPILRDLIQNFEPFMLFISVCVLFLVGLRSVLPLLFAWLEWRLDGEKRDQKQRSLIKWGWISILLYFIISLIAYPNFLGMYLFEYIAGILCVILLEAFLFIRKNAIDSSNVSLAAKVVSVGFGGLIMLSTSLFYELRNITVMYFVDYFYPFQFPEIAGINIEDIIIYQLLRVGDLIVVLPFVFLALTIDMRGKSHDALVQTPK